MDKQEAGSSSSVFMDGYRQLDGQMNMKKEIENKYKRQKHVHIKENL